MRALLCSGQGRIERGMFSLFAGAAQVEPIRAAAGELLGSGLDDFFQNADDDDLTANRAGQILCVSRALAAATMLAPEGPFYVAGYSVGEMSAWGVAGFWDEADTLALTARRAELMDAADNDGGLGFIRGLDAATTHKLLLDHRCAIAIRNPGNLFIIGGARADVADCCAAALRVGAASARPIAVRVASHTPRLAAAVEPFMRLLASKPARSPRVGVTLMGAADAQLVGSAQAGVGGLARQLSTMVDWAAVLTALDERGVVRFLELGPGSALAEMVHAAFPNVEARAVDDFKTLEGAKRWFDADCFRQPGAR
jgi:[acyl-carrier-protein] S-malonyltransferase